MTLSRTTSDLHSEHDSESSTLMSPLDPKPTKGVLASVKAAVSVRYGRKSLTSKHELSSGSQPQQQVKSLQSAISAALSMHAPSVRLHATENEVRRYMKSDPDTWPDMCWQRVFAVASDIDNVHIFRAGSARERDSWLAALQAATRTSLSSASVPTKVRERDRTSSFASGDTRYGNRSIMSPAADMASPGSAPHPTAPAKPATSAPAATPRPTAESPPAQSSTDIGQSCILPPRPKGLDTPSLKQLRHMRRKPDSLLKDPTRGWSLLVRCAKAMDRHSHRQTIVQFDLLNRNTGDSAGSGDHADQHDSSSNSDGAADEAGHRGTVSRVPSSAAQRIGQVAGKRPQELQVPLRKQHWLALVPRYMPVLCDQYTAGRVWNQLTADTQPVIVRTLKVPVTTPNNGQSANEGTGDDNADDRRSDAGAASDSECSSDGAGARHRSAAAGSVGSNDSSGDADDVLRLHWEDGREFVLRYEVFERYVTALCRTLVTPPSAWEALREALELDPRELVVKVETYVDCILSTTVYAQGNSCGISSTEAAATSGLRDSTSDTHGQEGHGNTASIELPAQDICAWPLPVPDAFASNGKPKAPEAPGSAKAATAGGGGGAFGRSLRQYMLDVSAQEDRERRAELYDSEDTVVSSSDSDGGSSSARQPKGCAEATGRGKRSRGMSDVSLSGSREAHSAAGGHHKGDQSGSSFAGPASPLLSGRSGGGTGRAAGGVAGRTSSAEATPDRPSNHSRTSDSRGASAGHRASSPGAEHHHHGEGEDENDEEAMEKEERMWEAEIDALALAGVAQGDDDGEDDDDATGDEGMEDAVGIDDHDEVDTSMDSADNNPQIGGKSGSTAMGRLLGIRKSIPSTGSMRNLRPRKAISSWLRNKGTTIQSAMQAAALDAITQRSRATAIVAKVGARAKQVVISAAALPAALPATIRQAGNAVLPPSVAGPLVTSSGGQGGPGGPFAAYAGLGLHPAVAASMLAGGKATLHMHGTFILTDRNIYFTAGRNEILVIPISSILSLEHCSTSVRTLGMGVAFGRTSDNGLHMPKCEVRRVPIDTDMDAEAGNDATPLKSLFALASALTGTRVPLAHAIEAGTRSRSGSRASQSGSASVAAAATVRYGGGGGGSGNAGLGSPDAKAVLSPVKQQKPGTAASVTEPLNQDRTTQLLGAVSSTSSIALASASAPASTMLAVHPSVTFVFSKVKDLLVARGDERKSGGRRQVVRQALDELMAAHRLGVEYDAVVAQVVKAEQSREGKRGSLHQQAAHSSSASSGADAVVAVPEPSARASIMSPALLEAITSGVTWRGLRSLPLSMAAWRQHLARLNRREARAHSAFFPRRLPLYAAMNLIRARGLLKATGRSSTAMHLASGYVAGSDELAAIAIKRFMVIDDPRWMLRLACWMSHERETARRRTEALSVFDRKRFKGEMDSLLDNFFHPLNTLRRAVQYIVAWETPPLTAAVLVLCVSCLWHDLLHLSLPLVLLLHAAAVLMYGSLAEEHKAVVAAALWRPRSAKARNLLERLRNFRSTLGNNQVRMHRLNVTLLKLRSLYTWRDPARTVMFLILMLVLAILFSAVPTRWILSAFLAHTFTRPLRRRGKGVIRLAFDRFWDGLPVPSASDAVYAHAGVAIDVAHEERSLEAASAVSGTQLQRSQAPANVTTSTSASSHSQLQASSLLASFAGIPQVQAIR